MELRRRLMMGMRSTNIWDSILEIADVFNSTEDVNSHTFDFGGVRGTYIIVSNPPGIIENKDLPEFAGDDNFVNGIRFQLDSWGASPAGAIICRSLTACTVRPSIARYYHYDYWSCASSVDGNQLTITFNAGGIKFKSGVTYYLIRTKQA